MTAHCRASWTRAPAPDEQGAAASAAKAHATRALAWSLALAAIALSGCATIKEYMPTLPAPSLRWIYDS
ncbi:MAG TPA: hypothetical protein VIK97_14415, partial [Casimicrobiaceae bacterium]